MPTVELLCLANSKKHGGRCVAGIRTDGGGWLRPVAPTGDGALYPQHYLLPDGTEPRLFDLLRVEVGKPAPKPHQPENWVITGRKWELIARPAPDAPSILSGYIEAGPVLFGTLGDRVSNDALLRLPARSSLAVIVPQDLKWHLVQHQGRGITQVRAHFKLGSATYDLVVTDPQCLERLDGMAPGLYPSSAADLNPDETPLLTVSLGEPYEGYCYKLVAAVASVPTAWLDGANAPPTISPRREADDPRPRTIADPHLAEFARARGSGLGGRLAEEFSRATTSRETEAEVTQRLRTALEDALREELRETARR